jgi:hypothetical protein
MYAGKKALVKVSGAAVAFVGEATTSSGPNLSYQITDATKRILDLNAAISVHKFSTNDVAELGTTTTNITMVAHGLSTGDLIVNTTRSNAARVVTVVDANNVTVAAITGQTDGDTIALYPTEPTTAYTLNRLNGTATYSTAVSRTIRITGNYLPMSTAAECKEWSLTANGSMIDTTKFQQDWISKIQGLKSAEGSLSQWWSIDTYFIDALISGNPVVIELYAQDTLDPDRVWALLNSSEISAAVDGAVEEAVSFESTDKLLMAYAS